jgi:hypothetical protein
MPSFFRGPSAQWEIITVYKFCLGVLLIVVHALPAFAQVQLEWKLLPQDKFFVEIQTANEEKTWVLQPVTNPLDAARAAGSLLACAGQPQLHLLQSQWVGQRLVEGRQKVETITLLQFEVLKRNDKETVLEQTILHTQINRAGSPASKVFGPQFKDLKLTVTLGPSLETNNLELEGYEAMLKSVTEKSPDVAKEVARFKAVCSEAALKQQIRNIFVALPAKAITKGDTWSEETEEDLTALGKIARHTTLTYEGERDFAHRITSTSSLKLKVAEPAFEAPPLKSVRAASSWLCFWLRPTPTINSLPFKVIRGELTSEKATGEIKFNEQEKRGKRLVVEPHASHPEVYTVGDITFDAVKGRLVKYGTTSYLTGALTIRFLDLDEPTDVTCFVRQEIVVFVHVLDRLPVKR